MQLLAAAGRYPEAEQHYAYARDMLRREVAMPDGGVLEIRPVFEMEDFGDAIPEEVREREKRLRAEVEGR